ncbi:hypothetical protein V9T40_005620 [Parthenolecanium corni]|uniref:Uncharacterized protein n=1 Tax=Parthenolecanium corni TaxID=536013 RepID=A0AAN9TSF6_9HEMI
MQQVDNAAQAQIPAKEGVVEQRLVLGHRLVEQQLRLKLQLQQERRLQLLVELVVRVDGAREAHLQQEEVAAQPQQGAVHGEYDHRRWRRRRALVAHLDTEITVSDEDFYEEHPFYVPPPLSTPVESALAQAPTAHLPYKNKLTISCEATPSRNDCKSKKCRKKPKITISVGGIQRSYTPKAAQFANSSLEHRISSSSSFGSYPSMTTSASSIFSVKGLDCTDGQVVLVLADFLMFQILMVTSI